MAEGVGNLNSGPAERPAGKIPTTNVTNEIVRAVFGPSKASDTQGEHKRGARYMVSFTGNEAGAGKYKGKAYAVSGLLCDPSRDVTQADIEVVGLKEFDSVLIVNAQERGASTHSLTDSANTNQKSFIAAIDGWTSEPTPRPVFVLNAIWLDDSCPDA